MTMNYVYNPTTFQIEKTKRLKCEQALATLNENHSLDTNIPIKPIVLSNILNSTAFVDFQDDLPRYSGGVVQIYLLNRDRIDAITHPFIVNEETCELIRNILVTNKEYYTELSESDIASMFSYSLIKPVIYL